MRRSAFLDTAHAIAPANERDEYHEQAVRLSERMSRERRQIVTTEAVLTEIGNRLAAPLNRQVKDVLFFGEVPPTREAAVERLLAVKDEVPAGP